jgi:LPS O-antigen subunit length determinant protein (WzzB/FepE family)
MAKTQSASENTEQGVTITQASSGSAPETPVDVTPKTTETQAAEKTFTQKELEATLHERLQRERQKYADYEQLRKAAEELQTIKDSQKSETEKMQEKLSRLEQEYESERAKRRAAQLSAKVATIAGRLGAVDPQDANFVMATQAIDPDGDGADNELESIIEGLKNTRPYLFQKPGMRLESFNPADGAGVGATETSKQRRSRLVGGGGMVWDIDPKAHGGGVIFGPGWDKGKTGG